MTILPLGDRVLIKPDIVEEKTKSGIVLVDNDKTEQSRGTVIALGLGKLLDSGVREPMDVAVGDRVLFEKWGGEEIESEGETYKILSVDKIQAILL